MYLLNNMTYVVNIFNCIWGKKGTFSGSIISEYTDQRPQKSILQATTLNLALI